MLLYIVLKCVATVEDYEMGSEGGFIEIVSLLDYLVLKLYNSNNIILMIITL